MKIPITTYYNDNGEQCNLGCTAPRTYILEWVKDGVVYKKLDMHSSTQRECEDVCELWALG